MHDLRLSRVICGKFSSSNNSTVWSVLTFEEAVIWLLSSCEEFKMIELNLSRDTGFCTKTYTAFAHTCKLVKALIPVRLHLSVQTRTLTLQISTSNNSNLFSNFDKLKALKQKTCLYNVR